MLKFEESTHTYTYNGKVIPSVTTVIEGACPLSDFAKNEASANFGTAVHKATELLDTTGEYACTEKVHNRVLQWIKYKTEHKIALDICERKMTNSVYAGTVDRISYSHDKILIIDIKTGVFSKTWDIQLSAYKQLFSITENINPRKIDVLAVQLFDDKYKIHKPKSNYNYNINIFNSMLNVYNWRHK